MIQNFFHQDLSKIYTRPEILSRQSLFRHCVNYYGWLSNQAMNRSKVAVMFTIKASLMANAVSTHSSFCRSRSFLIFYTPVSLMKSTYLLHLSQTEHLPASGHAAGIH